MRTISLARGSVRVSADLQALTGALADFFLECAQSACQKRGRFAVALSGGSTPRALYSLLSEPAYRDTVPWDRTHLFWGDERCVPHDSPESNYRMVAQTLLSKITIPEANIHATRGQDKDPARAASDYQEDITRFFSLAPQEIPEFDLILLGLGPDGHTASLFPDTGATEVTERLVTAVYVPRLDSHRLSLTLPVLNGGANVTFMVAGEEKSEILRRVVSDEKPALPAQMVEPKGSLYWYVDSAAARLFEGP